MQGVFYRGESLFLKTNVHFFLTEELEVLNKAGWEGSEVGLSPVCVTSG